MWDPGATQGTLHAGITTSLTLGTLLPLPRWKGEDSDSRVTLGISSGCKGHERQCISRWAGVQGHPGKALAVSFHGAHRHGNQTSEAGLQQSQGRQASFLSISQELNRRGRREVGTIRLSEPGSEWRQGEEEAVFLFNALPSIISLEPSQLSCVPHFLPADPSRLNQFLPLLVTQIPPLSHIPSTFGSPRSLGRVVVFKNKSSGTRETQV